MAQDNIVELKIGQNGSLVSGDIFVDYTTNSVSGPGLAVNVAGQSLGVNGLTLTQNPDGTYAISGATTSVGGAAVTSVSLVLPSTAPSSVAVQATTLGLVTSQTVAVASNPVVCFASGTLIRTVRGEIAVQDLATTDSVVTATGALRPVRWIGTRAVDCARCSEPQMAWPVRVAAHAFAPDRPSRDLLLSPQHAVAVTCLAEVLIPVRHLINGATIAQVEVDAVRYYHVELDSHDILLAEGLPCESFLETSPRAALFDNGTAHAAAHPGTQLQPMDAFCRPLVETGPVIAAVRAQLATRAEALGWTIGRDPDLHLLVDGRRLDPVVAGLAARFAVPAGARDVRLRSKSFVPRVFEHDCGDGRRLGVPVRSLTLFDGLALNRVVPIDHPALADGFHDVERDPAHWWRWSDGDAVLAPELWAGAADFLLRVELSDASHFRCWEAPAASSQAYASELLADTVDLAAYRARVSLPPDAAHGAAAFRGRRHGLDRDRSCQAYLDFVARAHESRSRPRRAVVERCAGDH